MISLDGEYKKLFCHITDLSRFWLEVHWVSEGVQAKLIHCEMRMTSASPNPL